MLPVGGAVILGVVGGLVGGPVGLVAGANIGAAAALTGETSANILYCTIWQVWSNFCEKGYHFIFVGKLHKNFFV